MTDFDTNPLTAITSKAKAKWKQNIQEQKKSKLNAKSSKHKQKNKKREFNKSKKNNKNNKNQPPLKKRKLNKSPQKKGKIDFDLPLEQQKKRSVIKLENMPTGLEEKQLEIFFNQFGNVTRYALKRHRYGRSLRFGYVEWDDSEIGNIVANALDSTSMYGQMLICKEIPPEKVDGKRFFKTNTINNARLNKKYDNDKRRWNNVANIANCEFQFDEWHQRLINNQKRINENLTKHGIKYKFNGVQTEIERQIAKMNGNEDNNDESKLNENENDDDENDGVKVSENLDSFLSDSDDNDSDNE